MNDSLLTLPVPADLTRRHANQWCRQAMAQIKPCHQVVRIDLTPTRTLDSTGLAALLTVQETLGKAGGRVRLLNPAPPIMQLLELTRMHRLFEMGEESLGETPETQRPILIVEDEPHIRTVCELSMQPLGRRVLSAHNGRDAINIARLENPSLIILDYVMPVMDGRQTLSRLKADEATRHIPVIVMSAHDGISRSKLETFAGAAFFLSKPFSPAALRVEAQRLIQNHLSPAA